MLAGGTFEFAAPIPQSSALAGNDQSAAPREAQIPSNSRRANFDRCTLRRSLISRAFLKLAGGMRLKFCPTPWKALGPVGRSPKPSPAGARPRLPEHRQV